jgi:VRR-NUC domain
MSAASVTRPTERECQDTIVEAARWGGWRIFGVRPARTKHSWETPIFGDKGWPDLVLVRGERILAVELKRTPNKPEPEQVVWLEVLAAAGVDARLVWVPEEMDDLVAELVRRRDDR